MFWELLLSIFLPTASFASDPAYGLSTSQNVAAPVVDSVTVETYSPQRTPFEVRFGDVENDYRVMAMFVLPSESVPVTVTNPRDTYEIKVTSGMASQSAPGAWTWVAPARPGVYPVEIREVGSDRRMTLNVFVMVPYTALQRGSLNGYRIGNYPRPRSEFYARPEGFIEVTPDMKNIEVSPHFVLGQFLCKQAGGPPEYLVLRQPLLVKLEQLLAEVNARGREAHSFRLLSAYRTPSYNAAIGNETGFSRHHYGDAADIFVDDDGDGRMDDLNRDGRHTVADARWLSAIVHETQDDPEFDGLIGGLGAYQPTHAHGAFVHVDVRGFQARWGA